MEPAKEPRVDLAGKILPPPLYRAMEYVFGQNVPGCALVGGSALAGFYAGHRRSDDLDLFTRDALNQAATVLAVKSLKEIGVNLADEFQTKQYYRATCELEQDVFTVDAVLDPNLFEVGTFVRLKNGVLIADLQTLMATKISTLVSRCSEKDLFDLIWLFQHFKSPDFKTLIAEGSKIDRGLNGESLLLSISGALLNEDACGFSMDSRVTPKMVFEEITKFRNGFVRSLSLFLKDQPAPPLMQIIKKIKKLAG